MADVLIATTGALAALAICRFVEGVSAEVKRQREIERQLFDDCFNAVQENISLKLQLAGVVAPASPTLSDEEYLDKCVHSLVESGCTIVRDLDQIPREESATIRHVFGRNGKPSGILFYKSKLLAVEAVEDEQEKPREVAKHPDDPLSAPNSTVVSAEHSDNDDVYDPVTPAGYLTE